MIRSRSEFDSRALIQRGSPSLKATRGAAAQRGPVPGFTAQTLHGVLKLAGEMYDDCVERVGPEPA